MTELLEVGGLKAAPGEVVRGFMDIPGLGEEASFPLALVNGAKPGPRLTVIAGIHGFEYGGIAAGMRLSATVDPSQLAGQLVLAPMVNRTAFEQRAIYVCPLDGKNLNRVFPGDANGSASEKIAKVIYDELILGSDAVVDLHAGDAIEALIPFAIYHITENEEVDAKSCALAEVFGLRYLLGAAVPGSTYAAASMVGIPAIIAEVGGQGVYDSTIATDHYNGVVNIMRHLGMVEGEPQANEEPFRFYGFKWAMSDHDATWHPSVKIGDEVKEGQKIGEIRSYFDEVLQEVVAPASGPVLFVVTSLAIRNGDPLLGIADLKAEPPAGN